jgi:hypothetical protein
VIDAHARPTPLGREIIARLRAMHAEHARLPIARHGRTAAHDA